MAELKGGAQPESFGQEQVVSREQGGLTPEVMAGVFDVRSGSVPAFIGVPGTSVAYQIIEVTKVEPLAESELEAAIESTRAELLPQLGQQSFQAYLAALKARSEIERFDERIQQRSIDAGE